MSAELRLDPDGLRRAAVTARRIAEGLDRADPGPSAVGAAGVRVEHVEERLRESVRRVRDELLALAAAACAAAARADETERAVAASLRAVDARAGDRSPAAVTDSGCPVTDHGCPVTDGGCAVTDGGCAGSDRG